MGHIMGHIMRHIMGHIMGHIMRNIMGPGEGMAGARRVRTPLLPPRTEGVGDGLLGQFRLARQDVIHWDGGMEMGEAGVFPLTPGSTRCVITGGAFFAA